MLLPHSPLDARKHLKKGRFYVPSQEDIAKYRLPLCSLRSCIFSTTPATSRAQFPSSKSTWLSLNKEMQFASSVTSPLAFGCQKHTQRTNCPQVKYRSPLYRRHTPTPPYFAILVISLPVCCFAVSSRLLALLWSSHPTQRSRAW